MPIAHSVYPQYIHYMDELTIEGRFVCVCFLFICRELGILYRKIQEIGIT